MDMKIIVSGHEIYLTFGQLTHARTFLHPIGRALLSLSKRKLSKRLGIHPASIYYKESGVYRQHSPARLDEGMCGNYVNIVTS